MKKNYQFAAIMLSCILAAILVTGCATSPPAPDMALPAPPQGTTIAVWNLENLSITPGQSQEMEAFLTNKVVETLKNESSYQVVEREKLLLALEELNIGSSALADQSTGLRIGQILGAKLMVFGAYQVIGGTMRIDLRMVEVESGRIIKTAQHTAQNSGITSLLRAAEFASLQLL